MNDDSELLFMLVSQRNWKKPLTKPDELLINQSSFEMIQLVVKIKSFQHFYLGYALLALQAPSFVWGEMEKKLYLDETRSEKFMLDASIVCSWLAVCFGKTFIYGRTRREMCDNSSTPSLLSMYTKQLAVAVAVRCCLLIFLSLDIADTEHGVNRVFLDCDSIWNMSMSTTRTKRELWWIFNELKYMFGQLTKNRDGFASSEEADCNLHEVVASLYFCLRPRFRH